MANVTPLKVATGGRNLGTFKIELFSMFDEKDLAKYADLRNKANDNAAGIKIEMMREYTRKTSVTETFEGGAMVTTNSEEILLVVHYWEKPVARTKGASYDEDEEEKRAVAPRG